MQSDPDEQDIIEAINGDVRAFKRLYERHLNHVYGLVFRLCGDRAMADDLTQDVFVQLWEKLSSFRFESKFSTWLYSVTSHICLSELRRQKRWFQRFKNSPKDGVELADKGGADLSRLDTLLFRLPEQARQVFVLHALEGAPHQQIANVLGIAVGTSKAQFHRARKSLEEWLEND
ncbi:RNA polymerase sigma factor [Idiomarina sp. 29L]|uniref:RNA polymerase sigma factor n=1 Tax=Idiomarina sp. 29L TaxID=2508877 RepID=UPI00101174D2|nr:RNA polymerase sigma factor [Idiomarina sp. 29L]RXS42327.1 RNA polymerase sigma factor [Idiomarina sp. 29L]